jgi:acetyl-CoA carboxylase carboxyl transferase subunit alpha
VISPEGCASILWKDSEKMREAAGALRLTAQDLQTLGVIDRIVPEPVGGAQRHRATAIERVGKAIGAMLGDLNGLARDRLIADRRAKFLSMGSASLAG